MDEIRAVRTVWQLLVALARSQKWGQKPAPKTGPQYYRKKERLPKWRPHFWDQGVAYTVSPPLRAVSSGDFGTFRLFSCQLAWQSFIQVSQYYTDVCVHGGLHCRRKAGASKWTKSGPSGPSGSSWLLLRSPKNGAKNRPQKRGRNITGRRKGFQNGGPISGTRVLHTQSAPLCVQWVAETSEHFVCFPANWLDKASSKFHIEGPPSRLHFSCADAVPKAGPGGSTVRAQADWQPLTVRKPIATDYGKTLAMFRVLWQCGHHTALKLALHLLVVH